MNVFEHRAAVLRHLQDTGWQIGRSQFYKHCDEGRLVREQNGTYTLAAVDTYAAAYCRRIETGKRLPEHTATLAEQREVVRLARERVKLKMEEHELAERSGALVARDEVEMMIVGRAVAMLAHLKAMVQMQAAEWIDLAEGNQARGRELIDTIWEAIEEHLSLFAKDIEFEVIFEPTTPAETGKEHRHG